MVLPTTSPLASPYGNAVICVERPPALGRSDQVTGASRWLVNRNQGCGRGFKTSSVPPCLTGDNVQGWSADGPEDENLTYVQVTCLACAQAHLVNPKTRKVRGVGRQRLSDRTAALCGTMV
jgi:hypothetical protein